MYSFLRMTTRPSVYKQLVQFFTYIDSVRNVVALFLVVPSLEIVPQPVGSTVHQHSPKELLFEVFLLRSISQIMQHKRLSPFDQPVKDEPDRLAPVLLASSILLTL